MFQKIIHFCSFPELSFLAEIQPVIERYLSLVGYEVGVYDGKLCVRGADNSMEKAQGEFSIEEKTSREIVELAMAIAGDMRMSDEEKKHHLRCACVAQEQLDKEIKALKRDIKILKGGL